MKRSEPVVINGKQWNTYLCSFTSPDGRFSFEIMAISIEHAAALLADLKETAQLDGQLMGKI